MSKLIKKSLITVFSNKMSKRVTFTQIYVASNDIRDCKGQPLRVNGLNVCPSQFVPVLTIHGSDFFHLALLTKLKPASSLPSESLIGLATHQSSVSQRYWFPHCQ